MQQAHSHFADRFDGVESGAGALVYGHNGIHSNGPASPPPAVPGPVEPPKNTPPKELDNTKKPPAGTAPEQAAEGVDNVTAEPTPAPSSFIERVQEFFGVLGDKAPKVPIVDHGDS
jgi:hypothetical protein